MRVVVAGGGTGGHVYSAVSVARKVLETYPDSKVLFLGSMGGPEGKIAERAGLDFAGIDVRALSKNPKKLLVSLFLFPNAFIKARRTISNFQADCVFGTGGYASAPACFSAASLGIPLILHEMNFIPGIVTKYLARKAYAVTVAFDGTREYLNKKSKIIKTGVPVREEIEELKDPSIKQERKMEAVFSLGIEDKKTLLVFGGSQGAEALNRAIWEVAKTYPESSGEKFQIVHITGRGYDDFMVNRAKEEFSSKGISYFAFPYIERMDLAYSCADLCLCRAGAGTIAELAAVGIPAVIVPYPHARNKHQEYNAKAFSESGAAIVVRQDDGLAMKALLTAVEIIRNNDMLENMRKVAEKLRVESSAWSIARIIGETYERRVHQEE